MIQLRGVSKTVQSGGLPLTILHPLDLDVPAGRCLAIIGPSGSGKSTLLGLIAGLDSASTGTITIAGTEITRLDEDALARAVANAPRILLADEPTGNLDPKTSERVFGALTQLVRASGLAMICATHNMDIAARMDRRVTLKDGAVVEME